MKKRTLITIIALALVLVMLLSGCSKKLKLKNAKIVDPKTGSEYVYTNGLLIPKSVSSEVYATFKYNGVSVNYYEVEGLDPTEWLYSEIGDFIYAGSEELPCFEKFAANRMYICYNNDVMYSIADITDETMLSKVGELYLKGTRENPSYNDSNTYKLVFESETYKNFYYVINLVVTADGYFIYSRNEGIFVNAGELFVDYVNPYSYSEDY